MFFLKSLPTFTILESFSKRFPDLDIKKSAETLTVLRKANLLNRQLDKYFAAYNLSQTRFLILLLLASEEEGTTMMVSEFVKYLDISKPVVTTTLQSLLADGYVVIEPSPYDKRNKRVKITDQGREILELVLPGYYTLLTESQLPVR